MFSILEAPSSPWDFKYSRYPDASKSSSKSESRGMSGACSLSVSNMEASAVSFDAVLERSGMSPAVLMTCSGDSPRLTEICSNMSTLV